MNYYRHIILILMQILFIPLHAQSIQDLIKGADKGDPEAIGKLGLCYYFGENGVNQDYSKAFRYLTESVNKGSIPSKYLLAMCYEKGNGTPQNTDIAIQLFMEAYEGGIVLAAKSLGTYYLNKGNYQKAKIWFDKCESLNDGYVNWALGNIYYLGLDVQKNFNKSFDYFSKSCSMGYKQAYYNLGLSYFMGQGIEKDENRAVELWKKCAEFDLVPALNKLGMCYSEGKGVNKDIHTAIAYWERAYSLGDLDASYNLAITYYYGDKNIENLNLAIQYWDAGAIKGHKESARKLGLQYLIGEKIPYSISKAIKYLTISADKGDADSQYFLGAVLIKGDSVPQDTIRGLHYMKLAADQSQKNALEYYADWNYVVSDINSAIHYWEKGVAINSTHCMNNLGRCYIEGIGKEVDYSKGFRLFENAYNLEANSLSLSNMADSYYNGYGVPQDYKKASELLKESINFDDSPSSAYFLLSKCYRFGRGVDKNIHEADRLLKIASQKGNSDAIAISSLLLSHVD